MVSTCLPGAITVHFYVPSLPPEALNPPGKGRLHQGLPTYALTGVPQLCAKPDTLLLKQPVWSQKTQPPAEAQCKTKHKQMTFPQHLHLHKVSAVLPHPVHISCCTVSPIKLSGQRRGLLKIADRRVKRQLNRLSAVQAQASQQDKGP